MPISCKDCGLAFLDENGLPRAQRRVRCSFCDSVHQEVYRARPRSGKPKERQCLRPGCGKFHRRGDGCVYCSPECRKLHGKEKKTSRKKAISARIFVRTFHAKCFYCGKWVTFNRVENRTIICSDIYCRESHKRNIQSRQLKTKECTACGSSFMEDRCGQNQCNSCKDVDRLLRTAHEYVSTQRVLIRDGWHCQHCHCETPKELRGTTADNAPEIDHILPIVHGGAHSYANTQCLCRRCNNLKRDRIELEPRLQGVQDTTIFRTAKYPAQPGRAKQHPCTWVDRTGQRYGKLTLVAYMGKQRWAWQCDCGRDGVSRVYSIIGAGRKRGCGGQMCIMDYSEPFRAQAIANRAPQLLGSNIAHGLVYASGDTI